jgi:predicted DNA-binding transcriptional regulator AlpA
MAKNVSPRTREASATSASAPRLLVTYEQLRGLGIPWSRVHLRRLCEAGEFVKPIRISEGRIAWRMSDVLTWLDERAREWNPPADKPGAA